MDSSGDKFIVKYRKNYYDLSEFVHKHPGGINTLKGLHNADMTERFLKSPPHSDAAMYLMKEYKILEADNINHDKEKQVNQIKKLTQQMNRLPENVTDLRHMVKDQSEDKNNNQLDESMEYLVDWSQAMVPQIAKITKHYDEWVHKPVDRPLRLFGPWYLEMCTKTPWWVVFSFWVPIIGTISWHEFQPSELTQQLAFFLIGIVFWTLLEYTLHRWVFHIKLSSNSSAWICTFHFMIHGLHHKVPFDPLRLVFPPLPGVVLACIIYFPISFAVPHPRIILAGTLLGYLCYDMMHYYLHYGNPTAKHMYHMKRYHYQHHFAHQDLGYGISSPLWDLVFKTRISLRTLKYQLRWS